MQLYLTSADIMANYLKSVAGWKIHGSVANRTIVGLGAGFNKLVSEGNWTAARKVFGDLERRGGEAHAFLDVGLGQNGPSTLPKGVTDAEQRLAVVFRALRGVEFELHLFIEDHAFNLARHLPSGAVDDPDDTLPSWCALGRSATSKMRSSKRVSIWNTERKAAFEEAFTQHLGLVGSPLCGLEPYAPLKEEMQHELEALGWSLDELDEHYQDELLDFQQAGVLRFS